MTCAARSPPPLLRFAAYTVFALLNARILLHLQPNAPLTTTDNLSGIMVGVVSGTSETFRVTVRGATAKAYGTVEAGLVGLKEAEVCAGAATTLFESRCLPRRLAGPVTSTLIRVPVPFSFLPRCKPLLSTRFWLAPSFSARRKTTIST